MVRRMTSVGTTAALLAGAIVACSAAPHDQDEEQLGTAEQGICYSWAYEDGTFYSWCDPTTVYSYCGDGICADDDGACALDCAACYWVQHGDGSWSLECPAGARPYTSPYTTVTGTCSAAGQPCTTWQGYQGDCKTNFLGSLSCAL